jgi:hypothetical protein
VVAAALAVAAGVAGTVCFAGVQRPEKDPAGRNPASPGARVTYQVLDDEETGLAAILRDWKAGEQRRHGGKLGEFGWWLWGLVAFDYDQDGCLDLLAQGHGQAGGVILRGLFKDKGKVAFTNVTQQLGIAPGILPSTFRPWIWDVDGDGWLDIVGTDSRPNSVFLNRGGKRFVPMNFGFGQQAWLADPVDLNGDGYLDTYSVRDGVRFLYDARAQRFRASRYLPPLYDSPPPGIAQLMKAPRFFRNNVQFFEGIDLNGDGIPDLVVGGFGTHGGPSWGRYFLGDRDGRWTDQTEALGFPRQGTPVLVQDLTGSGAADVLVAAGPAAGLYVNDGKGKFTRSRDALAAFMGSRAPHLHQVFAVDLNNDGLLDLVVSRPRGRQVAVFQNLGGGAFASVGQEACWDGEPVAIGDFNNDGLLDLAIGGPGDTITILLNQTANAGKYCNLYPRMATPNPFAVGARVEVFRAGQLGKRGARPLLAETAHPDGSPVHVGLGSASRFDLRVTFPGKKHVTIEDYNVEARPRLRITAEGKLEEF